MSNYDVIIVGGGPGGMSALLWCNSLGLRGLLLEQANELGGQLLQMFHQVIDYPGIIAADGRALREQFAQHLAQLKLVYRTGCRIEAIDLTARRVLCDGIWLQARALILATGARQRRLNFPGADAYAEYEDPHEHTRYAGQPVCVIGGGDSAVENSLILASHVSSVTLIHRSDQFRARAEWLQAAQTTSNIHIVTNAQPHTLNQTAQGLSLLITDTETRASREIPAAAVFIRVGIVPNTELLTGQLKLDHAGFIQVDQAQCSSQPLVYAVGDVCNPICWSVATATGQAAIAVKAAARHLRA